jgi:hypothetical protein
MRNGRQRVLQPWSALARGNEKAEKHPHGLDDLFCLLDPTTSGALEEKGPESFGLKGCGLRTEGVQQIKDGEAVGVECGLRGPAMHTHPLSKRPEDLGLGWWWEEQGSRRDKPRGLKEGDKVAGTQKYGTVAPARIAQGLSSLQVMTEPLKCLRIELLDA